MSEEQNFEQGDAQEAMEGQQTSEQGGGDGANGEREPHQDDDDRKLFVGGLSWETTEAELKEYMETFGKVVSCNLKKDLNTDRSRGFGFVVFEEAESLEKVLAKSDGHKLQGKTIDPKRANPKGRYTDPPVKKIYVAKVSPSTTEDQIKEYFGQWGKVEKVETPFDKEKEMRRNFVFVEFDTEDTCNKVLNVTEENKEYKHKIGSDEIEIRKATPGRGGGRGRGGFFRGGDRGGRGRGGYGGYGGGWNEGGYGNQGGYGGQYGQNYGNGYGNYGGYGQNYGYDPNYQYGAYGGYGGGWGSYDQSGYYSGYGGYDYSGGWGGYGDQSGQQMGTYGKAQQGKRGGSSGYRPY